jgi:hypothetical protein
VKIIFDVYTSKASKTKRLNVVPGTLHLWRANVKTIPGIINISMEDFFIDKSAP